MEEDKKGDITPKERNESNVQNDGISKLETLNSTNRIWIVKRFISLLPLLIDPSGLTISVWAAKTSHDIATNKHKEPTDLKVKDFKGILGSILENLFMG